MRQKHLHANWGVGASEGNRKDGERRYRHRETGLLIGLGQRRKNVWKCSGRKGGGVLVGPYIAIMPLVVLCSVVTNIWS